ncbi:hypothetical protein V1506DRAFT_542614 [Lipomyces tetrasporus]
MHSKRVWLLYISIVALLITAVETPHMTVNREQICMQSRVLESEIFTDTWAFRPFTVCSKGHIVHMNKFNIAL